MRVFKTFPLSSFNPVSKPQSIPFPWRACRESRWHRPHPVITHACRPGAAVSHHNGNPAPLRSRPRVRLAITAVPKLTPVSEKPRKIRKNPSPNFPVKFSYFF
jgi:hypothetical protein